MGKLRDEDITGKVKGTVFNDHYAEVLAFYNEYDIEEWEEAGMLVIKDTKSDVGLRDHSDVIIVYDQNTCEPMLVTERIHRRNEGFWEWRRHKRLALNTVKFEPRLFNTFDVKVSIGKDYIDYIYTKGDWEKCLGNLIVGRQSALH